MIPSVISRKKEVFSIKKKQTQKLFDPLKFNHFIILRSQSLLPKGKDLLVMKDKIFKWFLDLFYPHVCFHCSKKLEKNYFYFCEKCLIFFHYIEPNPTVNYSAVFANIGPILTFIKEMRNQKLFSIFKTVAAFMVVQHSRLKWDIPDVIVPMEDSRFFKNHIFDLSKEVAKFFKRPVIRKTTSKDIVLIISDNLNLKKLAKIKSKILYKKIYYLALCFDIFFDDFNLSE